MKNGCRMSPRAERNKSFFPVLLFFGVLWAVFQFAFPGHLAFKERYVLFLSDASWLSAYFRKPAPISYLAGDWLSQFLPLVNRLSIFFLVQPMMLAACS